VIDERFAASVDPETIANPPAKLGLSSLQHGLGEELEALR
jgi:hypothetical protein